ncbi:MAG: hypothetical protein ACTHOK_02725 [Nocardioidaceae bacterium]
MSAAPDIEPVEMPSVGLDKLDLRARRGLQRPELTSLMVVSL